MTNKTIKIKSLPDRQSDAIRNPKSTIRNSLIASCGMNCGICIGYLRDKNKCAGCNADSSLKVSCINCSIKNCEFLSSSKSGFCYDCPKYPCRRIKNLDKRYRTKYGMSMIENLNHIKQHGIRSLIRQEKIKWACKNCGSILSAHRESCLNCGLAKPT